jgi:hypothetical protein
MKTSVLTFVIAFLLMLCANSLTLNSHLDKYDQEVYRVKPSCCRSKGGQICRSG